MTTETIETLTAEQEAAMDPFAKSWIERMDMGAPLNEEAATKGIQWLYEFCGLVKPEVRFVASPSAAAKMAEEEQKAAGEEVDVAPCFYGSYAQDAGWVAFYSFFQDVCNLSIDVAGWPEYRALIDANVYDWIQLEGLAIGCPMPVHVMRDSDGQFHSTGGLAVEWSDGTGIYALHGVRFDRELHEVVTNRTIKAVDVVAIKNIEQRMAAMSFLGSTYVFDALGAKFIHQGLKGAKHYEVELAGQTEYFLRYNDTTDGQEFASCVDRDVGAKGDADECMAWKHHMTREQYLNDLNHES